MTQTLPSGLLAQCSFNPIRKLLRETKPWTRVSIPELILVP